MRREAVVCDLRDDLGYNRPCPSLADYVCPVCRRDVCRAHHAATLLVQLGAVWPKRPQSGGMPPKDETVAAQEARVDICTECFSDLGRALVPSVKALAGTVLTSAVEAYGADLAGVKLERSATKS